MVDLIKIIKVFLKNLKYNDDYSEQSSASTSAYTMCVPNCISIAEDENYIDDSYPNSDFEVLDEFDEEEIEEELAQIQKYKQLEEQIGCPLEVLFRALKDGVYSGWVIRADNVLYEKQILKSNKQALDFSLMGIVCFYGNDDGRLHLLKDYKKTWWLKKNKSE